MIPWIVENSLSGEPPPTDHSTAQPPTTTEHMARRQARPKKLPTLSLGRNSDTDPAIETLDVPSFCQQKTATGAGRAFSWQNLVPV